MIVNQRTAITSVLLFFFISLISQDILLLQMQDKLPSTALNPAFQTKGKFNLSVLNFQIGLNTNGPAFNEITAKNSSGKRYIDVRGLSKPLNDEQFIEFNNEIATIDFGIQLGNFRLSAGHSFKAYGMIVYPKGILEIASQGNAPFIGQTIPLNLQSNVSAFNQLYLGLQSSIGKLSVGGRLKLIYGTANLYSEKSNASFTTLPDFYQTQVETDFIYRSSSILGYNGIDDIQTEYDGFTFDNIFYNNRGIGVDLGLVYNANDKTSISLSVNDINSIKWDYEPRKYVSKGTYTFEGVDIFDVLVDTTDISIIDSLQELLNVTNSKEAYSTRTPMTINFGIQYKFTESLSFMLLHQYRNYSISSINVTSLGIMKKFGILSVGGVYSISNNNYFNIGLMGGLHLGPLSIFASTDNVYGLVKPLDSKKANARLGATFSF